MVTRRQLLQAVIISATTPLARAALPDARVLGALEPDPDGILDLPAGFRYRIVARAGEEMDDGLLVPPRADGMAAFGNSDGSVTLVCNHENYPGRPGPFGAECERLDRIERKYVYDFGGGVTPGSGGTTTIVFDPRSGETQAHYLSLAGTEINCAGGPMPWGSWLSCEECFTSPGIENRSGTAVVRERRHGYVFEVPARHEGPVMPVPITAMGRFEHEAAAVDPATGIVYLSEDKHESLLYRYIPETPGRLVDGGRLQAMAISGRPSFDTRNWDQPDLMPPGRWFDTYWIDIAEPDPDENVLRLQGFEDGAACFARGEGLTFADGSLFMTATIGGPHNLGQVFEYRPAAGARDTGGGRLKLLAQCSPSGLLRNADNLTMSPWGDLVVCEDTLVRCGLIGLTRDGGQYPIAMNSYTDSELAGATFAPDGRTLFVNIQDRGLTLAIDGPWPQSTVGRTG